MVLASPLLFATAIAAGRTTRTSNRLMATSCPDAVAGMSQLVR
jgi:hypothetical protein